MRACLCSAGQGSAAQRSKISSIPAHAHKQWSSVITFRGSIWLTVWPLVLLQVMPVGEEKKTQKVALGDLSGVVQVFSVKKGEIATAFKTLPDPTHKVGMGGKMGWGGVGGWGQGRHGRSCLAQQVLWLCNAYLFVPSSYRSHL